MNDRIKQKLQKLIALATDGAASQGEIDNALAIANQLMLEHNLTRDDIIRTDGKRDYSNVKNDIGQCYYMSSNKRAWEDALSMFVTEFIGTIGCYLKKTTMRKNGIAQLDKGGRPSIRMTIHFYGPQDDIEQAKYIFDELHESIQTMAIVLYGGAVKGDGGTYCQGFVSGLRDANIREVKKLEDSNDQTRALILVANTEKKELFKQANDWLKKEKRVTITRGTSTRGSSGSREAYQDGKQDGASYDVTRAQTTKRIS